MSLLQQPRLASLANASTQANRSSTSLITPALTALSDPPVHQVDAHLVDFLAAEVIQLIIDSEAASRSRRLTQEKEIEAAFAASSLASQAAGPSTRAVPPPAPSEEQLASSREEVNEGVRRRINEMGFKVGWALAERLTRDRQRFPTTSTPLMTSSAAAPVPPPDALEAVKFICKDIWIALYDKQIDNLRTNHRGVYVLLDNSFKPLSRVSGGGDDAEVARRVKFFLALPAGIIRGALATLGISCTVAAESPLLPQTSFQIKTVKPGAI